MMGHNKGFTLIELTLSMTFVSILLISVAMLSIQLTNQYSRGLTLKEVAQAGTEASNDIKRTMAQEQLQDTGVQLWSQPANGALRGGWVLCTGTYSYVANSADNLSANNGAGNDSVMKVGEPGREVSSRLTKVRDQSGVLCGASSPFLTANKVYATTDASELLSSGSRQLVVRSMVLSPNGMPGVTEAFYNEFQQGRGIYKVQLTIGTGVESEIQSATTCKPPTDQDSNLEFCAINTFEFTTRVGSSNG